jgi:excisionase family DNA binding protein
MTHRRAAAVIKMKDINAPGTGPCQNTEPELVRKRRFAEQTSVSNRTIDNWIRDGRIPFLRIGGVTLIPWREALETLNRNYRLNARK